MKIRLYKQHDWDNRGFTVQYLVTDFFPKITIPTWFTHYSASLLDNIYCKLSQKTINTTTGIIFTGISDHLPPFVCLDNISNVNKKPPKYVKKKVNKPEAIAALINEIRACDILSSLDHSLSTDPNLTYNHFIDRITEIKSKHLPHRFVKYNKHRHKNSKWISYGILNSIKSRDKIYLKLKCTNPNSTEYDVLKRNLNTFNCILKRAIREAKTKYYESVFEQYKHDVK